MLSCRNLLLTVCVSLVPAFLYAQTQASPTSVNEPEFRDQFVAVIGGQLLPLEREKALTDTQNRRNFVITPSTRVFQSIPQPASPVRVPPGTHFVVRMGTGDRDPQTLIHLEPLKATKKDREITKMTYKESLIPFGGVKHDRAADNTIAVTIHKFGSDSLEIIPQAPLPPGEYAFVNGYEAQCFGVDANASEASSSLSPAATAHASPPPPAKPAGWSTDPIAEISSSGQDVVQTTAGLMGRSTIHGRAATAYLAMHCGFPATEYPGLLPLEVVLGGTDEMFNVPGAPGSWLDISDFASSKLGTAAPVLPYAVAQNRSNGARIRFFYDWRDIQQIVNEPGQVLALSLASGQGTSPGITAVFALPGDNAPLKGEMSACLAKSAQEQAALQAKVVATCPSPAGGTILDSVALKYADTGKAVKGEFNEEDFGATWSIPVSPKTHAARRMSMTCSYRPADTSEGTPVAEKTSVPVPATARFCSFTVARNTPRNVAMCLSAPSREAALLDVSRRANPAVSGSTP